jgi:hypothetical protein
MVDLNLICLPTAVLAGDATIWLYSTAAGPHAKCPVLAGGAVAIGTVHHMSSTCTLRIHHQSKLLACCTYNVAASRMRSCAPCRGPECGQAAVGQSVVRLHNTAAIAPN